MRNTLKIVTPLLHLTLYIFLIIFLSACGEEPTHSSSETGSIAFCVEFQGAQKKIAVLSQAIDCGSSGIATVEAKVYDENDSYLTGGGPWNCEAHSGTITGVPAGSNRKVVILGKDSSGNILYCGEKTGISVIAGATNNGGVITASLFVPENVRTSPGDSQVTISWDSVTGATSYNIYWAISEGVSKDTGTKISDATSPYIHTDLDNGTTYYYVVTAENDYGESDESSEVDAMPFSWTMLNLPDTGQTQSYTDTFGEDSDYTINPPSYTDNGDGTVTDNVTGLMWQQEDDDTTRTWDDATSYCEDLALSGYSDWRLPSAMELMSIVDYGTYSPSIDTTYFSGTSASYYWSSTTLANDTSYAWGVGFSYGNVGNGSKSSGYYVRCVRGGQ